MKKEINLSNYNTLLEKMHDETITRIVVKNDTLSLYIDELHFSEEYTKAELMFLGFEDIYSDVYFEFFTTDKLKISGNTVYLDDFFNNKDYSLLQFEIVDIFSSFQNAYIKGSAKNNTGYVFYFNLYINAKFLTLTE